MTIQGAADVQIAIKRQSGLGVPASGSGADGYNVLPTQGLKLDKGRIENTIIRRDGQRKRNRHGQRSASAAYKFPLSVATLDPLLEAALRGTYTATFNITEASVFGGSAAATSITTTTSTIVAAAGSFLLQGVRVGQKIKLANHSTAANNGKWLRVLGVTALTITVPAASLTLNAVADTAFTITVAKYLTNPTTLVERYHTIDESRLGIDRSILGTDMKLCKMEFNAQPENLIELTMTFMGLDATGQVSGSSPVLTTPTYSTTIALVMSDGTIRIGGVDYSVLTGMQWTWDMGGSVPKVLAPTGPDVILSPGKLSGNFSVLNQDLVLFDAYRAETAVDIFLDCQEPDATDPKDFISFYFGDATLSDNTTQIAQSDAMQESVPWDAGIDETGGDRVATTMLISTSAA